LNYVTLRKKKFTMEFSNRVVKNRKVILVLWIIFLFFSLGSFLIINFIGYFEFLAYTMCVGVFGLIITSFITIRFFNWPIVSFLVVMLGIYFKTQHWPLASVLMTVGTFILSYVSLWIAIKIFTSFRNNSFLKWVGFVTGIIITLFMMGFLFGMQHWSGLIREILGYSGCFLFILSILAIVFTLPNSKYIGWSGIERKVFFKTILIPMIFIFGLIILIFVFSDTFNAMFRSNVKALPWNFYTVELFKLEGIPAI
jgi:hypothetical protein